MATWDQDIHRIQEIQQLLENRQRYFCGQLNTSCYKVDNKGNPLYFPKLHQTSITIPPPVREPSFDHSVEVNFGSSDGGAEYVASHHGESEGGGGDADASSDVSDSSESPCEERQKSNIESRTKNAKKQTKTKKMSKKKINSRKMRGWVEKNVEQVSSCDSRKSSVDRAKKGSLDVARRRPSVSFRQKSVSFDEAWVFQQPLQGDDEVSLPSRHRHKKKADPIDLLKKKSWLVCTDEDSTFANERHDDAVPNLRKGSLKLRRETKNSKSFVPSEVRPVQRLSVTKEVPDVEQYLRKRQSIPKADSVKHQSASSSRLVSRHAEEALKSDMNLREAFALIKIDPDPIIKLATLKSKEKHLDSRRKQTLEQAHAEDSAATDDAGDDPATKESLKRLTKLSLQHKQKQKSFMNGRMSSSTVSFSTRRSSTISQGGTFQRRKSKDVRNIGLKQGTGSFEDTGRKGRAQECNPESSHFHSFEKLSGTVL